MQRLIDCLLLEHDLWLTFVAMIVCMIGSGLTARLFMRTQQVNGDRMAVQLGLTGVIAGTSVWATHFLSMLAYNPVIPHAYDFMRTALSLAVAVFGISLALAVSRLGRGVTTTIASGTLFGVSVAAMHFIGMWAFLIAGTTRYEGSYVGASILAGVLLGCLMMHRLVVPMTRYCWLGAAAAMVLTVCAVHFIAMAGLTVIPNPTIAVPEQVVPETVMAVTIVAVMFLVLAIGFGSFLIETKIANETRSLVQSASLHDTLTQLPNRSYLQTYLLDITEDARNAGDDGIVVFTIDVDQFRAVNTQYGNQGGDVLLQEIAKRLRATLMAGDFLARTGSDEFVIVCRCGFNEDATRGRAMTLLNCFAEPMAVSNGQVIIGASIGSARYPADASIPQELLQKSQYAMKQAKITHGNRYCAYDAAMDQESRAYDALVADVRQALVSDQFFLDYQRQNDIHTHDVVGFEVLCRWRHPDRGLVPPSVFIPIAEDIGLICNLGIWVLREACQEAVRWKMPYRIAVNVAPQQLAQPDFVDLVQDILATSGLPPDRLELEITEASIIHDQEGALTVMHKLKAMGISIAMDDFGTGYSSLASLQAFPFDKIKIDRSFVKDVHVNPQRAAIVRSTLLLGAALDIPILAEGIETLDELAFLQAENCKEAQGFFFGRPMSVPDVRVVSGIRTGLQKAS